MSGPRDALTGRRWHLGAPLLVGVLACQVAWAEPARPEVHRGTAPAKGARAGGAARLGHTVRAGDSLWLVARRYGVSVDALSQANGIRAGQKLRIGQHLAIPGAVLDGHRQEPPSWAEIVLGPPPDGHRAVLRWPLRGPVASPFGARGATWHGGVDLRAERGALIRAAGPGMVIMSGWERAYGHVIKIWHAQELMTVYAHNAENRVRVGEWVEGGQVIATVGSTGRATAPHLHFEVRLDGRKYDPLFWLPAPGELDVATSLSGHANAVP